MSEGQQEPVPKWESQCQCQNCGFLKKEPVEWGFNPYCHGFGNHIQGVEIPHVVFMWIKRYGCASHSSTPSPETCAYPEGCRSPVDCPETRKARQEERERLLGEAIEKLWHMPIYPEENPKERIQEMLESLRECGYSDEVLVAEIPLWRDARARGGWQR